MQFFNISPWCNWLSRLISTPMLYLVLFQRDHFTMNTCVNKTVCIFLAAFTTLTAASFEPYELNGGLVSAVAGDGYSIIGTDTRMIGPCGYLLSSRNYLSSRIWSVEDKGRVAGVETTFRLGSDDIDKHMATSTKLHDMLYDPTMIVAAGCAADCEALKRAIKADIRKSTLLGQLASYPAVDQVASCLSHILYSRRGFPFYSFCCVAGLGGVFVFDAIGSFEQVAVASAGAGHESLQPILDRKLWTEYSKSHTVALKSQSTLLRNFSLISLRSLPSRMHCRRGNPWLSQGLSFSIRAWNWGRRQITSSYSGKAWKCSSKSSMRFSVKRALTKSVSGNKRCEDCIWWCQSLELF